MSNQTTKKYQNNGGDEELNRRLRRIWLDRRFLLQTFEADVVEDNVAEADIKALRQLLDEDDNTGEQSC